MSNQPMEHTQDTFTRYGGNDTFETVERHTLTLGPITVHGAPSLQAAQRLMEQRIHAYQGTRK